MTRGPRSLKSCCVFALKMSVSFNRSLPALHFSSYFPLFLGLFFFHSVMHQAVLGMQHVDVSVLPNPDLTSTADRIAPNAEK